MVGATLCRANIRDRVSKNLIDRDREEVADK